MTAALLLSDAEGSSSALVIVAIASHDAGASNRTAAGWASTCCSFHKVLSVERDAERAAP
jgi:hypothetical protein